MRFTAPSLVAVLTITLAGCLSTPAPEPPPGQGTCNAANASFVIGQPATPDNVEAARLAAGAGVVRVIRPGEAVTMDFSEGRLNLELNASDVVTNARCG